MPLKIYFCMKLYIYGFIIIFLQDIYNIILINGWLILTFIFNSTRNNWTKPNNMEKKRATKEKTKIRYYLTPRCHTSNKVTVINVCILTSQMNLFILYQVFIFYTVKLNTDFENIKKKIEYFWGQYSFLLYKM